MYKYWSDIQQPQMWQLIMEAGTERLAAMAFSPSDRQPMRFHEWEFPAASACEGIQALENTIYDHPGLLTDFGKVTLLYDTLRMVPIPDTDNEADAGEIFRSIYPPCLRQGKILLSRIPEMGMALCFEIPADTENFLRRTFPCITIDHPVAPLCRYFRAKHPLRRRGKTLVNIRGKRLDIITLGEHTPLAVSSHFIADPMDAVYYILASRQGLELRDSDEIMIAGDRTLRAAVTPILRRYVRYVMPALFPSVMYRAGKESLAAPFELVVSPLINTARSSSHSLTQPPVTTIKDTYASHENNQR
ncbi:MAG: DUF3822 family protein [Bacteroidales bacterium]|nr:DUF3822 family protein [Bacteroidales bacterium]